MKLKKSALLIGTTLLATGAIFYACQKDVKSSSLSTTNVSNGKVGKITSPTITCGDATQASINITVCAPAGGTGLPAGFSLQWMTAADFATYGWPKGSSDDVTSNAPSFCKASFSGNANLSRYNLTAGECATVNVGDFLFDEGASTSCIDALQCGTQYVFRAFGHATSTLTRSDFTSPPLTCSTLDCGSTGQCTYTQGYWKTHNPLVCDADPSSPLCIQWPVTTLTLGTVSYDVNQLVSIFNTPASGNGLIALAHQLIAAKLNIANGSDPSAIQSSIDAADLLIGSLVIPPVGSGFLAPSVTSALTSDLTNYNEGAIGPGHCN
jgi:hypothetical protein